MEETVRYCEELLQRKHYEKVALVVIPRLLATVERTKRGVELLIQSGGFSLLCNILSNHLYAPWMCRLLMPIVLEFGALLCAEYQTFDEDIGEIPLLTHFLCERHLFSVDIHWNFNQMYLLNQFLDAHIAALAYSTSLRKCTNYGQTNHDGDVSVLKNISENTYRRIKNFELFSSNHTDRTRSWSNNRNRNNNNEEAPGSKHISNHNNECDIDKCNNQIDISNSCNLSQNDETADSLIHANGHCTKLKNDFTTENEMIIICNMYIALITYPPHRVVPQISESLSRQKLRTIMESLEIIQEGKEIKWESRQRMMELLLSIACCGIGHYLAKESLSANFVYNLCVNLADNVRCACGDCEKTRKLMKAVKHRDEIGLSCTNCSQSQQNILASLLDAGIIDFMCKILSQGTDDIVKMDKHIKMCVIQNMYIKNVDDEQKLRSNSLGNNVNIGDAYLNNNISVYQENIEGSERCKELVSLLLHVCHPIYKRMYGNEYIVGDMQLLSSLLLSIDFSDIRCFFLINSCTFAPGTKHLLEMLFSIILGMEDYAEKRKICIRISSIVEVILRVTVHKVMCRCTEDHVWIPNVEIYPFFMCSMLQILSISSSNCVQSKHVENQMDVKSDFVGNSCCPRTDNKATVRKSILMECVALLEMFVDSYEYKGTQVNKKYFLKGLIMCMAVLVDGIEYNRTPQNRRRFLQPPPLICGWMATAARKLVAWFDSLTIPNCLNNVSEIGDSATSWEGCIMFKHFAQVVICRAEKCSALCKTDKIYDDGLYWQSDEYETTSMETVTNIINKNFSSNHFRKNTVE